MIVGSLAGLGLAFAATDAGPRLPGPGWLPVAIGVALMSLGMAFRYWSVRTLGEFFRVTVGVEEGQRVVDSGPYALVRHPSYTGFLVTYLGVGIALDSWPSVAAAFLLPTFAVLNRIRHEERMLREQLGAPYESYSRRTKRLVPGLW